jgi:hypothetical protein
MPKTKKNIARIQQEKAMMSIASSMPSFWQPQFLNSQSSPVTMQQFQQPTTTILATFSAVLPSVAGNSVNSAAAANPRNIATTT